MYISSPPLVLCDYVHPQAIKAGVDILHTVPELYAHGITHKNYDKQFKNMSQNVKLPSSAIFLGRVTYSGQ